MDGVRGPRRGAQTGEEGPPQQLCSGDAPDNPLTTGVEKGLRRRVARDALGVVEVILVVRSAPSDGERVGEGLAGAAGAAHPLLVVEPLRRDVSHHHGAKASDVDADLHRGSDAQHVDPLVERALLRCRKERSAEPPLALPLALERLRLARQFLNPQSPRLLLHKPAVVVGADCPDRLLQQLGPVAVRSRADTRRRVEVRSTAVGADPSGGEVLDDERER